MPLKRVTRWLKKFEKYLFYYKDGYFVLPYLTNTPELMLESLRSMPFVSQDPFRNVLVTDNPFTKGELHYQEIEDGLWLMVSEQEFKSNVRTKAVFDDIPSEYYFLAFSVYQNPIIPALEILINDHKIKNNSWAIYRPGVPIDAFHIKGTKGLFFNFSFSKKWAEANLLHTGMPSKFFMQKILDSELGYLTWDGLMADAHVYAKEIWQMISHDSGQALSKLKLKIQTLEILTLFFEKIEEQVQSEGASQFNKHIDPIYTVKETLMASLTKEFPGIEVLAEKINTSPSKLKSGFKKMYGQPPYQYFRGQQMHMALKMLQESDLQIKYVSSFFGYENPSKFSVAFRKVHDILPSEVVRK
ncbi:MAG TPA: AraC family transcriptional regulator [Leadbetterella sp.]|nr:AraC family transcriptional regulator [Leadbetterella sp.]